MIIVKLKGGLGNQLFQYAFGRALSETTKQPLLFDNLFFQSPSEIRDYELSKFSVHPNCSLPFFIRNWINVKHRRTKNIFLKALSKLQSIQYFKEAHFEYDDQIFQKCEDGVNYYDGYWQSPQYFNAIRPLLLKELKIKLPLSSPTLDLAKRIQRENAISIHVRRGDYATNNHTNDFHGLCSLDYYKQAIHLLSKEKDECSFYIFSDDMVWTKENLKISGKPVYYVEHTTDATNYEDLYLMSICKHQIIANSSFSWWGAWLNEYSSKQIIAPKKWFADDSINTNDLIPAEWIRI